MELTSDMQRVVLEQRLGFVATVTPDGRPNVSPKGTTTVFDERHLMFADLASPGTIANLASNPAVEVNVVDPIVRKGYRFRGRATVHTSGEQYERGLEVLAERGYTATRERVRSIVIIEVTSAAALVSPAYDDPATEETAIARQWLRRHQSLHQPATIRRAKPPDATSIADVWLRSRHASIPAIPPPVHPEHEIRQWIRDVVVPMKDTWVAEVDGGLVAMLVLDDGWVNQLYVDPDFTGRGIGTALLDVAKDRNPHGLDLRAFQSNTGARRFYERHGFVAIAMTDGENEEGAPDVRYRWAPAG